MSTNEKRLREALEELAQAAEDYAGSEPDMPSHRDTEARFERALDDAKELLAATTQAQDEPAGVAGTMPGSSGFTMAVFLAEDVPVGTNLYAAPLQAPEPAQAQEPIAEMVYFIRKGSTTEDCLPVLPGTAEWQVAKELITRIVPLCTSPPPAQQEAASEISWGEALRISELPNVDEALRSFSHDSTEDGAVCLVQAVLHAASIPSPAPLQAVQEIDWKDMFEKRTRERDALRERLDKYEKEATAYPISAPSPAGEPQCCGNFTTGAQYMGNTEIICCGNYEPPQDAAMQAAPQATVPSEREAFEIWFSGELDRYLNDDTGTVAYPTLRDSWNAALASPVAVSDSEILLIGAQLANVAFNWAQHEGKTLTAHDCTMLKDMQKQWDAAAPSAEKEGS